MKQGFRDNFKKYKRKEVPLDLSDIIDFNHKDFKKISESVKRITSDNLNVPKESFFGCIHPCQWEIFEFVNKPGLIFIKNPFLTIGQRYWIVRCLQYYTKKPSKLNIDAHDIIKTEEDWWEFCQRRKETNEGINTLEKLRWATFGYHHNWDTKEYSEDSKCDFPNDLKVLCSYIGKVLKFCDFNAEAAIINMYHFGTTLSGHTDHSEVNVTAPLFSFSFGQSAIFLIGGSTIEDETIPILLQSGDIVIMSGESRLCYHGIPRILPADNQPWHDIEKPLSEIFEEEYISKDVVVKLKENKFWEPFESYVNKSRINMNVRQVLLPGQSALNS